MDEIRLVKTSLKISYELGDMENAAFIKEYYGSTQLNDDPLGAWLKSPKIRKESDESDQVILKLLIELHRKVDDLTQRLQNPEHSSSVPLLNHENLKGIGHGYFQFESAVLEIGKNYYGRIDMPTFPKRQMPIFFEAISEDMAKIILMHEDDERDWSAYMVACERLMIRELKGYSGEY